MTTQANNTAIESSQINSSGVLQVAGGGTGTTTSTGTGAVVLANSPTLVSPNLGTPSTLVGTNITGTAAGLSIGGNAATATTAANGGVTSIAAGTGISVSGSTGGVTISNTSPGVSYSAGNGIGIAGSTIALAAPGYNTVGAYAYVGFQIANGNTISSGGNYSAGTGNLQLYAITGGNLANNLSGTWKYMGATWNNNTGCVSYQNAIAVRVS